MKFIFSPWRMEYMLKEKPDTVCVFCDALCHPDSPENLVVARSSRVFMILNRYPYTSGHCMVVPNDHCASLVDIDIDTCTDMMKIVNRSIQVIQEVYKPQGYNVGINMGEAAGAGILDHVHMHIVPRWSGDTNFMSSLAVTRVLPETLDETYARIKRAWEKKFPA